MSIALLLSTVMMLGLSAIGIVVVPRIWSGRYKPRLSTFEVRLPTAFARGSIRALPVVYVFLCLVGLTVASGGFREYDPIQGSSGLTLALAFSALFCLCLVAAIVCFNRPKFLVPPYLRGEAGAFSEWWADRGRPRERDSN